VEPCLGCEQYIQKIDELNAELRSLKRSNIKLRKSVRYKSRKLSKLAKEASETTQHFRNHRKKDQNYNQR
jgi:hypothetical protein